MPFFWLSFCDATKPKGTQFLGVLIVQGEDFPDAVRRAWNDELNPGGEVEGIEIPDDLTQRIPDSYKNRLLTLNECKAVDAMMKG